MDSGRSLPLPMNCGPWYRQSPVDGFAMLISGVGCCEAPCCLWCFGRGGCLDAGEIMNCDDILQCGWGQQFGVRCFRQLFLHVAVPQLDSSRTFRTARDFCWERDFGASCQSVLLMPFR